MNLNLSDFAHVPPILDFEASSLNASASYPISVGLVVGGQSYYWEIVPKPEWTDWSEDSERIHGLSLAHLRANGLPADTVRHQVKGALIGHLVVYSDCPRWEKIWARALGLDIDVQDVRSIIGSRTEDDLAEYASHVFALGGLLPHHAESDAIALALAVGNLESDIRNDDWTAFFEDGPGVTEDFDRLEQGDQPPRDDPFE